MFALAVSLAGQALFIYGLLGFFGHSGNAAAWACVAIFESALAAIVPNFLHRVASAYASAIALAYAFVNVGGGFFAPGVTAGAIAWLWLNEARLAKAHSLVTPVAYGLTLAFIQIEATTLLGRGLVAQGRVFQDVFQQSLAWVGEALVSVALLTTIVVLARRAGWRSGDRSMMLAIAAVAVVAAASFKAPGIAGGLMIVVVGFATANAVLVGIGVAGLILYVSGYYYMLELTLLHKAAALAAVGAALLAARAVLLKLVLREASPHA